MLTRKIFAGYYWFGALMEKERLLFRRQFLLSKAPIPRLAGWNGLQLSAGYYLYSHPDLEVTLKEINGRKLALLGYVFDYKEHNKGNDQILSDVIGNSETFDGLLSSMKRYAGRYVVIYIDGNTAFVANDALGLREVYYSEIDNRILCGSQPNLISEFSKPLIKYTEDKCIRRYYECEMRRIRSGRFWVGNETLYSGVKHLLPNHYLNLSALRAFRYWPTKKLAPIGLDEAAILACEFLEGILLAAANRSDLMMAVTAGTDSRTLLAASKKIRDRIYYFINKHKWLTGSHPDIAIPKALFKHIGLPFHVHEIEDNVDPEFRRIFLNNTFLSSDLLLPAIYNVYYKEQSYRMNVLGVGEIGRAFYGKEPKAIDGYLLARSMKIRGSRYAVKKCQEWLNATLEYSRNSGISIMTLLLWEQLLGNWGAVGNSESDIAIEEFDPFNSHYLYEILLSVNSKQVLKKPDRIFRMIIGNMWPELLRFPINPAHTKQGYVHLALKKLGVLNILKSASYRIERMAHMISLKLRSGHD